MLLGCEVGVILCRAWSHRPAGGGIGSPLPIAPANGHGARDFTIRTDCGLLKFSLSFFLVSREKSMLQSQTITKVSKVWNRLFYNLELSKLDKKQPWTGFHGQPSSQQPRHACNKNLSAQNFLKKFSKIRTTLIFNLRKFQQILPKKKKGLKIQLQTNFEKNLPKK